MLGVCARVCLTILHLLPRRALAEHLAEVPVEQAQGFALSSRHPSLHSQPLPLSPLSLTFPSHTKVDATEHPLHTHTQKRERQQTLSVWLSEQLMRGRLAIRLSVPSSGGVSDAQWLQDMLARVSWA